MLSSEKEIKSVLDKQPKDVLAEIWIIKEESGL